MVESPLNPPSAGRLNHASAAERASYAPAWVWRRVLDDARPLRGSEDAALPCAVLFADISGFTPLTAKFALRGGVGAEELSRLLNDYFGKLLALVTSHGGEPLKFAGDALLALWPAADGDLALANQRAAACALAIQHSLFRYDAGGGTTLSLRVAVAQGNATGVQLQSGDCWHFVLGGAPLIEVALAQTHAQPGDAVVAACCAALLEDRAAGAHAGSGTMRLMRVDRPPMTPMRLPRWPAEALQRIDGYVPEPIRARLAAGHGKWLAELRQVTVLFAEVRDLDHTAPGWPQRLQAVVDRVQPIVSRFEGLLKDVVIDDKGVGLIVIFGLPPFSHEDDATRGVRAALAIAEAIGAAGHGAALGVTTGRCFCGVVGADVRREYAVIGDAMNTAARLKEAAARMAVGPRILCDTASQHGAAARIEFETLAPILVKGKDEPISIGRPLRVVERRASAATGIVGRQRECAAIADTLGRAARGEAAGTLLMVGEAGIGKSRLVAEHLRTAAELGVTVLQGAGDAIESGTPYFAWRSVFAALFGVETLDDAPTRRAAIERWLGPGLAPRAPLLEPLFALGGADTPETAEITGSQRAQATRRLLLECLERAAATRPTTVVLEDAHWFDSWSWQLILEASRQVDRLALCISSRPMPEPVPDEFAALQAEPRCTVLAVGPLSDDDTLALACRRLGATALLGEIEALIRTRAAGHPFFAEELASSLREIGVIEIENGTCRFARSVDVASLAFPDTVQGLVTSRIDRLPPREQLVLKVASVIGSAFAVRLLREIHPVRDDIPRLDDLLDALRRAALTVLAAPEPDRSYAFNHIITHEVAYDLMLFAQRRMLHQAVAEWYERAYRDDRPELLGLLAHHWSRAGVVSRAVGYLEKSAVRSFTLGYPSTAVDQGLQAARLLGVTLPLKPAEIMPLLGAELGRIQQLLAGRAPSALLDLPRLHDENVESVIGLLLRMQPSVHVSAQGELFALIALRCMTLTLEHGNGGGAPLVYSMYAMVYRLMTQDTPTAFAFSRLAIDLDARQGRHLFAPVVFIHSYFIHHWMRPAAETLELVAEAADVGFANGDLMYASFNNSAYVIHLAHAGRPLSEVMDVARRNYARNGRRVLNSAFHCILELQLAKAFAGLTRAPLSLTDDEYDEERELASVFQTEMHEEAGGYLVVKARLHYLFDDAEGALGFAGRAAPYLPAIVGQVAESELAEFRALALLSQAQALGQSAAPEAADVRARLIGEARGGIEQIRRWAA
ncbi:MAG: AAA family ATPase, partial [Ramlibacter sp.]